MRRQRDELVAAEPPALRHRAFVSEWMTLGWRAQMMLIAYECAYIGPNGVVWYHFTDMESLESHTRIIHQIMPGHLFRWTINAQPWIGWHVEDEVWWYTYGSRAHQSNVAYQTTELIRLHQDIASTGRG